MLFSSFLKTAWQKNRPYFIILILFIAWLFFLYLTALITFDENNYQATSPWFSPTFWARWDSIFYVDIATQGYTELTAVFFPLYPLLIKILYSLGVNPFWAGHIISSLFSLVSLFYIYKLIKLDFSSQIALWSIGFLLLFPTSFFLIAVYPMSLLLFLFVIAFYAARKNKWLIAGFFGGLAALTKFEGILLFPILGLLYLKDKDFYFSRLKADLSFLLFIPAGLAGYSFYLWQKFGQALLYFKQQCQFNMQINWPHITFLRYFERIRLNIVWGFWRESLVFILILLIYVFIVIRLIQSRGRLPAAYFLFISTGLFFPLLGDIFISTGRFLLPFFPVFILFALIKSHQQKIALGVVFGLLLFLFTSFFINWHWVS